MLRSCLRARPVRALTDACCPQSLFGKQLLQQNDAAASAAATTTAAAAAPRAAQAPESADTGRQEDCSRKGAGGGALFLAVCRGKVAPDLTSCAACVCRCLHPSSRARILGCCCRVASAACPAGQPG